MENKIESPGRAEISKVGSGGWSWRQASGSSSSGPGWKVAVQVLYESGQKGIEEMMKLRILMALKLFWVIRESFKCQCQFPLRRKADGGLIIEQRVVER